jgi:hypothetical protein
VEPWVFGETSLPQTRALAGLLRELGGLALAMESDQPAVDALIAELDVVLKAVTPHAPADPAPRVGADLRPERRVYVDHSRDVGSYNAAFPEYSIEVNGALAHGEVEFPLVYEGPPGLVHGGVLGTFFDCVVQHHNCDVGVAGRTTSLLVEYRRPTPLLTALTFEIERQVVDRRIVSQARLSNGDELLCSATVKAVEGDRSKLPPVSPRRSS